MAVCTFCGSLDDVNLYQEELKQLSWLSEEIFVLYEENRGMLERIKSINTELENFDEQPQFEDDSDDYVDENDDVARLSEHYEDDQMKFWLAKEEEIRWILSLQLRQLCQDVQLLPQQGQLELQHRHRRHAAVPRHLWGHQTVRWRPQQPAQTVTRCARRSRKLLRWLARQMPRLRM